MSEPLREGDDRWFLGVSDTVIDQCCFDYGVALRVSRGPWELRIEQPFSVTAPDGTKVLVVPEEGAHLAVVLDKLLRGTIRDAFAFKDGRLELQLADGTVLEAPADDGFEAWVITGPVGVRVVSLPGGDLAVWGAGAADRTEPNS